MVPELWHRSRSSRRPLSVFADARLSVLADDALSTIARRLTGKKERWYKTLKVEAIRKRTPLSLADARAVVEAFVLYYNTQRLHSAIGYVTPQVMLEGRAEAIIEGRRAKLAAARQKRRDARLAQFEQAVAS